MQLSGWSSCCDSYATTSSYVPCPTKLCTLKNNPARLEMMKRSIFCNPAACIGAANDACCKLCIAIRLEDHEHGCRTAQFANQMRSRSLCNLAMPPGYSLQDQALGQAT